MYDDENIIHLTTGAPAASFLSNCCDMFEKATTHRLKLEAENNGKLFEYGPSLGSIDVRGSLASYLSEAYGSPVHKEHLVLTSGATSGLHLILSNLVDLNGIIFVDEATYMYALHIFQHFSNMTITSVKLNKYGVDTDELESVIKRHVSSTIHTSKLFWGMYYTIPIYHNPTGIVFSEDICQKLINIARKYDLLIVCDDVYNLLNYASAKPVKRLFEYDNFDNATETFKGNVISNGSFSKIIAPGFRVGWMECPPRCVKVLNSSGLLNSGGCQSQYTSGILQSILELRLVQPHLNAMKQNFREKMSQVCEILRRQLPKGCTFEKPKGGYFIWIGLPKEITAQCLNNYCIRKYKISIYPGDAFCQNRNCDNYFRIAISFQPDDTLKEAVTNLCKAIKELM